MRLKETLLLAQKRMKEQADKRRKEREFSVGDWVYLKLHPYRQNSVSKRRSPKLTKRYYGPFKKVDRVGKVAYKLQLPEKAKIHNVFHVSLLKGYVGDPEQETISWPEINKEKRVILLPERVIGVRQVQEGTTTVTQLLVQWRNQDMGEATWENLSTFQAEFPNFNFNLEVEVITNGGGDCTAQAGSAQLDEELQGKGRRSTRQRIKSRKYPEEAFNT